MGTTTSSVFGNPDPTPSQDTPAPPPHNENELPLIDQINAARSLASSTQYKLEQAEAELERLDAENQELHDHVKLIIEPMKASYPKFYKGKDWKDVLLGWALWYAKVQDTINWNVSSPDEADKLSKSYDMYMKLDLIKAIVQAEDDANLEDIFNGWRCPSFEMPFEEPGEPR